jgi:uncharacterized protein (TIGR02453 family)
MGVEAHVDLPPQNLQGDPPRANDEHSDCEPLAQIGGLRQRRGTAGRTAAGGHEQQRRAYNQPCSLNGHDTSILTGNYKGNSNKCTGRKRVTAVVHLLSMTVARARVDEQFAGFPDEAIQFFLELQAEQSRTWFNAHKSEYQEYCRKPLELLVYELQRRLGDVYPHVASVEPHIFRIQRDTRFAKDKAPYKTNVAADMPIRPRREGEDQHTTPGMYFSFGLDGEFVAIGAWHMEPDALAHYRAALDDKKLGRQLKSAVDKLVADGWRIASMETLKRVPPPYSQDHPCAELLKHKGLALSIEPTEGISARPEFVDWVEAKLREAVPVVRWLDKNLG